MATLQEIENEILNAIDIAVKDMTDEALQIIDGYLFNFYGEFTPKYYNRTFQFRDESVRPLKLSSNCTVIDIISESFYHKGAGISEEDILYNSMFGNHGGAFQGVNIWENCLLDIGEELPKTAKRAFKSRGIPIK